jgi:hypothetical protein
MSTASARKRYTTFATFWPHYVREHRIPLTRWMHFVGTSVVIALLVLGAIGKGGYFTLMAPVAGYGPAWASHFFVEKNRPATFTYPLWSLLADFKMWFWMATGKMDAECNRCATLPEGSE